MAENDSNAVTGNNQDGNKNKGNKGTTRSQEEQPVPTSRIFAIIEMGDRRNRNFLFPISQRLLRGAWKKININHQQMNDRLTKMPDIPGMRLAVDTQQRGVGILDPLNAESHKNLLKKINDIHQAVFNSSIGPEKDVKNGKQTDTNLKSWLYWMRRYVDAQQAVVIKGELPEMDDILLMPGLIECNQFDQGQVGVERTRTGLESPYKVPEPEVIENEEDLIDFAEDDDGVVE